MPDQNAVLIANFPVRDTTRSKLVNLIYNCILTNQKCILFFANTNFIVTCDTLKSRMRNDDIFIVNDGLGMDIACMLLHGRKFKSNLNGTDFMPYLFSHSKRKLRVFLLGGNAGVLEGAADFVENKLNHQVVGTCDGYNGIKDSKDLVKTINDASAEVILVALGNAQQEEWILANYQKINANFFAGVGGLFDFWSGYKPRAPKWVQKIRMEWLYRLCLEPKRLYKRYTVDIFRFLVNCIKYRKQVVK
ncbi:MAG: WecB/TagA/CpsF family glycosyltransferase [Methylotenera sp.]|uniref:WecB/TagA/CpsF family glycosyltransferase n=1 Tax=Methylotenera sp. TaxID=2051956 RepID=UPI0024871677|nr:WecB/TagA/CpsF family glycosyltransferase [Methylotenera sp.]MDI1310111.1 WecB/TagA/CpsF family glycosyltransferase [Methylotenera sp.]